MIPELRAALEPVADKAVTLPWAKERPWKTATHVTETGGVPTIDLHDLSVKLALDVVERARPFGGVLLIVGRGSHTGGASRLRDAIFGKLDADGVEHYPRGKGRVMVIFDRDKAPSQSMGVLFWLFVLVFGAAVALTIYQSITGS